MKVILSLLRKAILILLQFLERDITQSEKIVDSHELEGFNVWTEQGWKPLTHVHQTKKFSEWKIRTESFEIHVADQHMFFDWQMDTVFACDLNEGQFIQTINGLERVLEIKQLSDEVCMYDITVDSDTHAYYSNGILSHNTILTSIFLLWYAIFHNNKNIMIIANKAETVKEILGGKIQEIYKRLPFYIKPGIINISQSQLVFDNGSKLKTQSRSKEPAIGFTIDILYIDEFAHIPETIINPYYMNALPTISSFEESKLIITSTPNGDNLFKKLVDGAYLPKGSPGSSPFNVQKVYWHQVKGRDTIWFEPFDYLLEEHGVSLEEVREALIEFGFDIIKEKWVEDTYKRYIMYHEDYSYENLKEIGRLKLLKDLKFVDLGQMNSWKQNEIGILGGDDEAAEKFAMQYDLSFSKGSKVVLNKNLMNMIRSDIHEFKFIEIPAFKILPCSYKDLKWIQNPDIFQPEKIKEYYTIISVDIAEGVGGDYSVISIFKIAPLSDDEIKKIRIYNDIRDFFRLEQIGLFRSHTHSVDELAHVLYMIGWHLLDPEKMRIVVEINRFGGELIKSMRGAFGGNNEFGTFPFLRYQHAADRPKKQIGLKVTNKNKNINVKKFQNYMERKKIKIYNNETLSEMESFSKTVTRSGNIQFKAQSGHDDIVMSIVNVSSCFDNLEYLSLIEAILEFGYFTQETKTLIEQKLAERENENTSIADYSSILNLGQEESLPSGPLQEMPEDNGPWGTSPSESNVIHDDLFGNSSFGRRPPRRGRGPSNPFRH